jgi:hypothetical protein
VDDFDGASPSSVIEKVKYALSVAQDQSGGPGLGFSLGSVQLELTAVQTRDVDGGLKIKIPYVDWEVGANFKIAQEQTQTISITLKPEASQSDRGAGPIDIPLTQALLEIAEIVRDAAMNPPVLGLDEAAVTLQFVLTRDGDLSLLGVSAKSTNVTTQKLVVGLVKS